MVLTIIQVTTPIHTRLIATIQPITLFQVHTIPTRIQFHQLTIISIKHIQQHTHRIHTILGTIQIIITTILILGTQILVIIITTLTITTPIRHLTATGRMGTRCAIKGSI